MAHAPGPAAAVPNATHLTAPPPSDSPAAKRQDFERRRRRDVEGDLTRRRLRDLEDLRCEDVAAQLALLGVPLKWQDHTLAELTDWRDRIEAAVTLRVQYRVEADWRATSLRDLIDMRLRAAKASEIAGVFGVRVDWTRYSWSSLESLRRELSRTVADNVTPDPITGDGLAMPGSVGRGRRPGWRPRDPDAIIEPTFAFDTPLIWSHPFGRRAKSDPDAILVPAFVTGPSTPLVPRAATPPGRDDLLEP